MFFTVTMVTIAGNGHTPNPFSNPFSEAKLRANPKTSDFMDDPAFVAKLREMQQDPKSLAHHMRDPRIMQSLAVLLGADISFMGGGGGRKGRCWRES